MTRRGWIGIAVLVALQVCAVLVYRAVTRAREEPALPFRSETLAPRPVPEVSFERADHHVVAVRALRGRAVIVHFWATWCLPCRDELPKLLRQAEASAIELLAVAVDDDWPAIEAYFGGVVPRAVVRPTRPEVHRLFGASTLPDTYLVDARGQLVERYAGARDWTSPAARRHLETRR